MEQLLFFRKTTGRAALSAASRFTFFKSKTLWNVLCFLFLSRCSVLLLKGRLPCNPVFKDFP